MGSAIPQAGPGQERLTSALAGSHWRVFVLLTLKNLFAKSA